MDKNHTDCQYILTTYHDEMMRLAQWEYCEYEYDFFRIFRRISKSKYF